jgi:hypothetical protein
MRELIRHILREEINNLSFNLKQNSDEFVLYEFTQNNVDFFVRFYEREDKIWRRGYWFKEQTYFQDNINKIKKRIDTEKDPRVIKRLSDEYEYFSSNINSSHQYDIMGKMSNPLSVVNTVSKITVDFLNLKYDDCDVLEIQHMKKSTEDVSTRLKLTQRSILKYLDTNKWDYTTEKSTSFIVKKNIDFSYDDSEVY